MGGEACAGSQQLKWSMGLYQPTSRSSSCLFPAAPRAPGASPLSARSLPSGSQDPSNRRRIILDDKLKTIFPGKV